VCIHVLDSLFLNHLKYLTLYLHMLNITLYTAVRFETFKAIKCAGNLSGYQPPKCFRGLLCLCCESQCSVTHGAVPWPRAQTDCHGGGLGSIPIQQYIRIMVNRVTMGWHFLWPLWFFPSSMFRPMFHIHSFICHRCYMTFTIITWLITHWTYSVTSGCAQYCCFVL
jgi:hypothetical protein